MNMYKVTINKNTAFVVAPNKPTIEAILKRNGFDKVATIERLSLSEIKAVSLAPEIHTYEPERYDTLLGVSRRVIDKQRSQNNEGVTVSTYDAETGESSEATFHGIEAKLKEIAEAELKTMSSGHSTTASIKKRYRGTPLTVQTRIGRNDLCPCGSGKKVKKCCTGYLTPTYVKIGKA